MPVCHTTGSEHFGGEKCLFFQALRTLDGGEGQLMVKVEQSWNGHREMLKLTGRRDCWKATQLREGQLATSSHVLLLKTHNATTSSSCVDRVAFSSLNIHCM